MMAGYMCCPNTMKTELITFPALANTVTFYIGRSQHENHAVIDLGRPKDLWFHLAGQSSTHVVAVIPDGIDRRLRGQIIRRGAALCKQHTAKAASLSSVSVTYAPLEYVRKTNTPGEVVVGRSGQIIV